MNFHTRRQKRGSSSKVVHSYFIDEDGCNASSSGGRECSQMTSHSFSPDPEEIGEALRYRYFVLSMNLFLLTSLK